MIKINLKEVLKEKNITGKQLAEMINITPANMSILVSGKAKAIRFSTLEAICEALDCQVEDLLKYEKNK